MREIDVHQLEELMVAGAAVIDVREPAEFAEAHVPGAVLIPMDQLGARIGELDKKSPVHLICRSGHRSAVMGELLEAEGFETVNVVGGTLAWVRAGKPFERRSE
jgi:rhodanese-related sulfurtransferase